MGSSAPDENARRTVEFLVISGNKSYGGDGGLVAQSCLALATPWTVACETPLSMGFSRQEHWNWLSFPLPGDLPNPGIKLASLKSPALTGGFFTTSATWEVFTK